MDVLEWDAAVNLPRGGVPFRGEQIAYLEKEAHRLLTLPKLKKYFSETEKWQGELDPWQSANVLKMKRLWLYASSLPKKLIGKLATACTESELAWRKAKEEQSFPIFASHLEKVLQLIREKAERISEALHISPYDALLSEFDPDRTRADLDPLFKELSVNLPPLIDKIIDSQASAPPLQRGPISFHHQKKFVEGLILRMGFSFEEGRVDTSAHPFTSGRGKDVRITTRFDEQDFLKGITAVLHEMGHAFYDRQLPQQWAMQPVGLPKSMMVHESQSLLLEMNIGRSLEFCRFLGALLAEQGVSSATPEEIYQTLNRVERGLIRVDADEVTYALHVLLRYELEKELIAGTLRVKELPEAWNEGLRQYLGRVPQNDAEGCLQDIHWSMGSFGYFPVYALGALMASQLYEHLEKNEEDILHKISKGQFEPLWEWLKLHIHQWGARYTSDELLKRVTGKPLDARAHLSYLKKKYGFRI